MRIGSIKDDIHIPIRMMFFDRGEKMRTEISSIQIFQSFFLSKIIEQLQCNTVHQHHISIQDSLLIDRIDALDIHLFIVMEQRFTEVLYRISDMMRFQKFFSGNISEIQIIHYTKTLLVIETKNMLACLLLISRKNFVENGFVQI